jgi:hypothetical protein
MWDGLQWTIMAAVVVAKMGVVLSKTTLPQRTAAAEGAQLLLSQLFLFLIL